MGLECKSVCLSLLSHPVKEKLENKTVTDLFNPPSMSESLIQSTEVSPPTPGIQQ